MDKILIVNVSKEVNKVNNILKKFEKSESLVLYLNNKVIDGAVNYKIVDDLISSDYFLKIYKEIRNLMNKWYKPFEKDLDYFDISLGQLLNFEFIQIWPVFFKMDVILNLIEKEKPKKIYLVTEFSEDVNILKEILKNKKIKLVYKKINKFSEKKIKFHYKLIAKLQNFYFKKRILKLSNKNKIFYLSNLRQSLPVLKELKKDSNNVVIRMGENLGRSFFSKYTDFYVTFKEFSTPEIDKKIEKIEKVFIKKWNLFKNNERFRKIFFYRKPLFKIIEKELEYFFVKRFILLIKYMEVVNLLKNEMDIVVTNNDILPFEKTIIQTANKFEIPTLTFIDGILSDNVVKKGTDYIPFSADKMVLFSSYQKKQFLREGINGKKLEIVGFPVFDQYFNEEPLIDKRQIYKKFKIPKNKKVILFIDEPYNADIKSRLLTTLTVSDYEKRYYELFKSIKEIPNLYLIIKPHPSGFIGESFVKNMANELNLKNFKIVKTLDIYSVVNFSDIIITRGSTVGLESMILRKPVIVFDTYSNIMDYSGFTKFGAALHAKKLGDLRKSLKKLLENYSIQKKIQSNMNKFVNENYVNDGKASKRLNKLIKGMIEHNFEKR